MALGLTILMAQGTNAQEVRRQASMLFIGDMMQHDGQIKAAYDSTSDSYDYSECFTHIKPVIEKADVSVCNYEVTMGGKPYKGYPAFSAPDEYADEIKSLGFDVFLTANNHCLDRGQKGVERTISELAKREVTQLGTYTDSADRTKRYPVVVESNGLRIAILNYTYGTNGLTPKGGNVVNYIDKPQMLKDIAAAMRMNPDYVIATIHWGIEYEMEENQEQRQLGRWLIDHGVDHVIGGHPHVVQPIDIYTTPDGRKHLIVYSLGNVISNMSKRGTDGGIMVGLTLDTYSYNSTAEEGWYTIFHVGRPVNTGLKNYVVYPVGTSAETLPPTEETRLNAYAAIVRNVMTKGDKITEKSCQDW